MKLFAHLEDIPLYRYIMVESMHMYNYVCTYAYEQCVCFHLSAYHSSDLMELIAQSYSSQVCT